MLNGLITLVGYTTITDGFEGLFSMQIVYGVVLWTAIEQIVRIAGLEILDAQTRRIEAQEAKAARIESIRKRGVAFTRR